MDSELHCKVIQGVKAAAGVKAFLILAVAALHFAVVARRIGPDELVADTQLGGGGLKQSREIPLAVGKTVGELKATPQNTQKERPCGKIPPGRAYIRHSISAAAALI